MLNFNFVVTITTAFDNLNTILTIINDLAFTVIIKIFAIT